MKETPASPLGRSGLPFLLLLPALLLIGVFSLLPLYGLTLAFREFSFSKGLASPWNGLANFRWIFTADPNVPRVLLTTLAVGTVRALALFLFPLAFSLVLDTLPSRRTRLAVLLILLFPQFLSWVVAAGLFRNLFAVDGVVNLVLLRAGVVSHPVAFMTRPGSFLLILFAAMLWKDLGLYGLLHHTALSGIEAEVYEAACLDGAPPWGLACAWHIKLPMIRTERLLVLSLVLVSFAGGAFEAVFNLYNPALYPYVDIVDSYVYRTGIAAGRFATAAALDLIKSLINALPALLFFRLVYRRMSGGRAAW